MQSFSRRGFQLRTASLETRTAYTGFLALMVLGLVTLVALSIGRVGLSAGAVAEHYRGGDSEMSFAKTFWQLMEVSHFHLFTVPVVVLVLTHLLYATPTTTRQRVCLTLLAYGGAFLDAVGPWAVRYVTATAAYVLLLGWVLLSATLFVIVALCLVAMWGPERWLAWLTPPIVEGKP